jgi:hypothetical protein
MYRNGISFANQWDMMTATANGGHGLFYFDQFDFEQPGVPQDEMDRQFQSFDPLCIPKGQYWALYLWSRYMGDRMVSSSLDDAEQLYTAVTRSDDALQILFVNQSRDTARTVQLDSSRKLAEKAVAVQLSHHEYFWNPYTRSPQWSRQPVPVQISLSGEAVTVPPFSALVLQVPFAEASPDAVSTPVPARALRPELQLLLPDTTPEDVPVEAWVLMPESGSYVPDAKPMTASLKIAGPATLDCKTVRLNEGAGRFFITPHGTGEIVLSAAFGKVTATETLKALPVQVRTETLWQFEGADGLDGIHSDYSLGLSDTAKPNQQTAAIELEEAVPAAGKGGLMVFSAFPENLPKERIGGVVFDVRTAHGFSTQDPNARIEVVLQSSADHWISIGSIPLTGLSDGWATIEFPIQNHKYFASMKWLYSIRLQLSATRPVSGAIYIDDAGVILR